MASPDKGRGRPGVRTTAILLVGSTIVGILLSEVLVRLVSANGLVILGVEMWRYAREVKAESAHPDLVEEHRSGVTATLMGVRIRTDQRAFRLPDPETEKARTPADRTVVTLGDSLTLGWGVPEGLTFSDLLEKSIRQEAGRSIGRGATVLNAGIGNSNTAMEAARYERLIRGLRPDWLILGFFVNDAEPDPVPTHSVLRRHSALAALIWDQAKARWGTRHRDYKEYYRSLYQVDQPGWRSCQDALRRLGDALRRDGVAATLLLLPEMHEPREFGSYRDIYSNVATLGGQSGFEVIDASRGFPPGPGERFWVARDDAHPNAEAHAIIASALQASRHLQAASRRHP